ncbi:MAG: DUF3330 domain-containing protein [Gallionella sp.]
MNQEDITLDRELVSCEICLKEVPQSEATVPEAADYVSYYCGLECYDLWKKQTKITATPL